MIGAVANNKYRYDWEIDFSLDLEIDLDESNFQDMRWRPDGLMFWTLGATLDTIRIYTVTTEFDITGASFQGSFDVTSGTTNNIPVGFIFNNDGTKMITVDYSQRRIYGWTLTTPWDLLGTVTYDGLSPQVSGNLFAIAMPQGDDYGKHVWMCNANFNWRRYDMSVAWDATTMSTSFVKTITFDHKYSNLMYNGNGSQIRVIDENNGYIGTMDLTTNWDITTATNEQLIQSPLSSAVRMGYSVANRWDRLWLGSGSSSNIELKQYTTSYLAVTVPTAVTVSQASSPTDTTQALNRTTSTGGAGSLTYEWYIDGGLVATTTSNPYTATGLTEETTYIASCKAKDLNGVLSPVGTSYEFTTAASGPSLTQISLTPFPSGSSAIACGQSVTGAYWTDATGDPGIGDTIYTNSSGTTVLAGGGQWFKAPFDGNNALQVQSSGVVTSSSSC